MRIGRAISSAFLSVSPVVVVAALTLAACQRVPIGRDSQDAAVESPSPSDGRANTQVDTQSVDTQIDTRGNTPAPPDASPDVADAAPTTTDATSGDGAGTNPCVKDQDCETYVDFCAATCGACVAHAVISNGRSACMPPANVQCLNACEGRTAVCMSGRCTLR